MTRSTDDAVLLDGRYRLAEPIGRGGMGTVYRATDTRLDRQVAVKLLSGTSGADEERFRTEVQTLARFVHPHLVRLLDVGEAGTQLFLVMDLVEGRSLAERLVAGPLSDEESAQVGAGIAAALAYVHREGVVHRDVKPANILLAGDGRALLADFGIARLVDTTGLTATGMILGTPAYLAPEQVGGDKVGPGSDVYALGLVLLECLTGRRAFIGTASEVTAARLQSDPPIPPELNERWRELLGSMTAREPNERIDASGVAETLSTHEHWAPPPPSALTPTAVAASTVSDTLAMGGTGALTTERAEVTAIAPPEPRSAGSWIRQRSRRSIVGAAAFVALVLGISLAAVFGFAAATGTNGPPPTSTTTTTARTASVAPTTTAPSTTTSTTTTTTPTTTTSPPSSPVSSAAGGLVSDITQGVANGQIDPQAGQQLVAQAQPLLTSSTASDQQLQQFGQLAQTFYNAVAAGQIADTGTVSSLTGDLGAIAAALGTSLPSPAGAAAGNGGPPLGHGHHGHGQGGDNGN